MPHFGKRSREVRETIHPVLRDLVDRAIVHKDITLLEGRRSKEDQERAFATGRSRKRWPESAHNAHPDAPYPYNLSRALDLGPWPLPKGWGDLKSSGPARDLEWKERVKWYELIGVLKYEFARMQKEDPERYGGYRFRCGADWDGDDDYRDQSFDDLPHIEILEVN